MKNLKTFENFEDDYPDDQSENGGSQMPNDVWEEENRESERDGSELDYNDLDDEGSDPTNWDIDPHGDTYEPGKNTKGISTFAEFGGDPGDDEFDTGEEFDGEEEFGHEFPGLSGDEFDDDEFGEDEFGEDDEDFSEGEPYDDEFDDMGLEAGNNVESFDEFDK